MANSKIVSLRGGITLIELIVVMVILVVAASLVVPTVQRSFTSHRVTRAADLVRSQLNRARIQAIRTGDIHGFFYYPETSNFKVAPFNNEVARVLQENSSRKNNVRSSNFDYGDEKLPKGVLFADSNILDDARSAEAFEQNNAAIGQLRPVLFYPDGSSQSAKLYLRSDDKHRDVVEINLRGMTGTSTSAPLINNRR